MDWPIYPEFPKIFIEEKLLCGNSQSSCFPISFYPSSCLFIYIYNHVLSLSIHLVAYLFISLYLLALFFSQSFSTIPLSLSLTPSLSLFLLRIKLLLYFYWDITILLFTNRGEWGGNGPEEERGSGYKCAGNSFFETEDKCW